LYGYQVDLLQKGADPKDIKDHKKKADPNEDDKATGARATKREYPPFFFIAINTNTKYAYVYPMKSKDKNECLRVIKLWYDDTGGKINSFRCDEEAGLDSREVNDWCEQKKISVKSIRDQNHTSLSVVDRFIRTLRDMNTPVEKSKRTSLNRKYRDFTVKRMNKLVAIYNDTTHRTTGHKPSVMQADSNNPKRAELEKAFIIKKIYESERRHKLSDYNLERDTYVKYIIPRDGKKDSKHRYQVSPEYYKIKGKDGHAYEIMAKDGSTLLLTRWRLIPVKSIKGMKMARTVNDAKHGKRIAITGHDPVAKTYRVKWLSPDGEDISTDEPVKILKAERKHANELLSIERDYWKSIGQKRPAGF
jgi:hypothetical protein